jgi:hypothetical protein
LASGQANEELYMPMRNNLSQHTRAKILLVVVYFMGVFAAYVKYSSADVGPDAIQMPGNPLLQHVGFFAAHILVLTALTIGVWRRQHWMKIGLLGYFFVAFIASGVGIPTAWYLTSEFPVPAFVACVTRLAAWLLVLHSTNLKRLANPAYVSIYTG